MNHRDGNSTATFDQLRPLLFSIAYRMLGSAADAEDLVQDTFVRWQRTAVDDVRSARHYLSATVTRLAIDHLRSARVRREVYVGPWLPEPLVGVDQHDPLAAAELGESLSTAFLVLLERLSPVQRAAFILREILGFDYPDIARTLETSLANARQLVLRAKERIASGRARFTADRKHASDLAERFLAACTGGDLGGLLDMLSADAVAYADGGGKFAAARRPVVSADKVGRFLTSVVAKWRSSGEVSVAPVNGGIGLVFRAAGRLRAVLTLAADDAEHVGAVFIQVNPDKLGYPDSHFNTRAL